MLYLDDRRVYFAAEQTLPCTAKTFLARSIPTGTIVLTFFL
jgi:hypothetical protein